MQNSFILGSNITNIFIKVQTQMFSVSKHPSSSFSIQFKHTTWTPSSFCLPWEQELFCLMRFTIAQLNTWLHPEWLGRKKKKGKKERSKESLRWLSWLIVHCPGTLAQLTAHYPRVSFYSDTHIDDYWILSPICSLLQLIYVIKYYWLLFYHPMIIPDGVQSKPTEEKNYWCL